MYRFCIELYPVSMELLNAGRKLADQTGDPLVGVILGENIAGLAAQAAHYGADKVVIAEDAKFAEYTTGAYLNQLIRKVEPQAVLIGNTAVGKDLAPRLAQRVTDIFERVGGVWPECPFSPG